MNDFVFKELPGGKLSLVGDFEGLYQAEGDPWQQSGEAPPPIAEYYRSSRVRLFEAIRRHMHGRGVIGLEVGCGHGHVVELLAGVLGSTWDGLDISPTAIKRAQELYPKHFFMVGDITVSLDYVRTPAYDVVVLGQMLWYVLHKMDTVIDNCYQMLQPDGLLVLSQAYLVGEQRYGLEMANGFDGTLELLLKYRKRFKLVEARYEDKSGLSHHDGLIVLRKV